VGEKCPDCGSELVYREFYNKKTKKKDKFIGCSAYPKCKYARFINKNKENDK